MAVHKKISGYISFQTQIDFMNYYQCKNTTHNQQFEPTAR